LEQDAGGGRMGRPRRANGRGWGAVNGRTYDCIDGSFVLTLANLMGYGHRCLILIRQMELT
jgi:hypothetical protein